MAIYHFSIKNIGRSNGRSAVAAAAYRSGEKLMDSVYGKEQDYTKKTGIEYKKIYVPSHAKEELLDRQTLWNEVEKSELKKNGDLKATARLAKEFEIAFPHEVDADTRRRMLDELAQTLVKNHHVVVDAVIHAPHTASGSDARNYHAHIMFTTRSINEHGVLGKKTREFNDDGKNLTLVYREAWANMVNRELEQIGSHERVSHLSYSDLKYDLEPTVHEGSIVTQLRRQGIDTEISMKNDAIRARNAEKFEQNIKGLDQEILATEKIIAKLRTESPQSNKNTRNHITLHAEKKDRLERKIEPIKEHSNFLTFDEKIAVVLKFNKKIEVIAQQIHEQQLEILKNKIAESTAVAQKSFKDFEEHRNNKPLNPFKIKAWEAELSRLADLHNSVNNMNDKKNRSDYKDQKNRGVTYEHYEKAHKYMAQKHPEDYKKIIELQQEIEMQQLANAAKSQDRDNDRSR